MKKQHLGKNATPDAGKRTRWSWL